MADILLLAKTRERMVPRMESFQREDIDEIQID